MIKINNDIYNRILFADFKYFNPYEFKCNCGKCKNNAYPAHVNAKLLTYLEQMRIHFGKPIIITSGLRCSKYNRSLPGYSKSSCHLTGMAADVYIKGVDPSVIVRYWKSLNIGYSYCGTPTMGECAHVQIGW